MADFHNPTCFASHMGLWSIYVDYLTAALASVRAGTMQVRDPADMCMAVDFNAQSAEVIKTAAGGRYTRSGGLATIRIEGPMQKGFSKFGGTSTIATRVAVREAVADSRVKAVMLAMDTPGGTVSGTMQLHDAIARAAAVKPVGVYIDDMMASAGVWATAGVSVISATPSAMAGSVGAMVMLEDSSGAAEAEGVKVHAITTGEFKAVGAPGVPVTDEQLAYVQERVDAIGQSFFDAVVAGRGVSDEQLAEIKSAKMYDAPTAQRHGLIDHVEDFRTAAERLLAMASEPARRGRVAAACARARLIS